MSRKRRISHASNWVCCPAWEPILGTSGYAQKGIDAHKEAEDMLLLDKESKDKDVLFYVNEIKRLIEKGVKSFGVETRVDATPIHESLSFGKIDFWCLSEDLRYMHIVDLKTGFVDVSPFENWSLMSYAYCLLDKMTREGVLAKHFDVGITLVLTIVQPNSYKEKIKRWIIPATELRKYWNVLQKAVHESLKEQPMRKGGLHCIRCDERLSCRVFDMTVKTCGELCQSFTIGEDEEYSPRKRLTFLTELKKLCEGLITAETESIVHRLKSGDVLPGLSLKPKETVSWNEGEEVKEFLKSFDLYNNKKPLTVKQAISSGKVPEELINKFTSKKVKYELINHQ